MMKTVIIMLGMAMGLLASCKKETLMPVVPGTYIRATHPVEIRIGNWKKTWDKMDLGVPAGTQVYVTAITDSVAVCINDYCYKLYRDQWAMACSLPYDGAKRDDSYLLKILEGKGLD